MKKLISVNSEEYKIIKLLGKGKGGYSYLAEKEGNQYVLKQIHHEPCSYYTFGNKIEAEKYKSWLRNNGVDEKLLNPREFKYERPNPFKDGPACVPN